MSEILTAEDIQQQTKTLATARDDVVSRAQNLIVTTAEDVETADALLQRLHAGIQAAEKLFSPMRESTTKAWRDGVALEKSVIEPLENAKKILSEKRGTASRAIRAAEEKRQREAREAEERRLREANEAEAARLAGLASAVEAEAQGTRKLADSALDAGDIETALVLESSATARTSEAEAIRETAVETASAPVMTSAPAPQTAIKKTGVSDRETWSAEVVDLLQLVRAAAKEPEKYLPYLEANVKSLNAIAKAAPKAFSVPGCRAVVRYSANVRGAAL